jgi:hypothetical protein
MHTSSSSNSMDNYAFTIRAPADQPTAGTFTASVGDIKPGCYRAVFKMLGSDPAGYVAVRWGGVVNYSSSRGDGSVIACVFGSYDSDLYHGTLYLSNPEPQLHVSIHTEDDALETVNVKPIISVDLQRLC